MTMINKLLIHQITKMGNGKSKKFVGLLKFGSESSFVHTIFSVNDLNNLILNFLTYGQQHLILNKECSNEKVIESLVECTSLKFYELADQLQKKYILPNKTFKKISLSALHNGNEDSLKWLYEKDLLDDYACSCYCFITMFDAKEQFIKIKTKTKTVIVDSYGAFWYSRFLWSFFAFTSMSAKDHNRMVKKISITTIVDAALYGFIDIFKKLLIESGLSSKK